MLCAVPRYRCITAMLRIFVGIAFLSAVGDRIGIFGGPGTPGYRVEPSETSLAQHRISSFSNVPESACFLENYFGLKNCEGTEPRDRMVVASSTNHVVMATRWRGSVGHGWNHDLLRYDAAYWLGTGSELPWAHLKRVSDSGFSHGRLRVVTRGTSASHRSTSNNYSEILRGRSLRLGQVQGRTFAI